MARYGKARIGEAWQARQGAVRHGAAGSGQERKGKAGAARPGAARQNEAGMKEPTRCKICIYPNTRPDTHFVDGVCSGCRSFMERKNIDYTELAEALSGILQDAEDEARERKAPYHCVVPISGGKDSTVQVLGLVERGAKVLAVNSGTDYLTPIGRRNLDNLKRFCDVIEYTPNIEVRKKLVRIGLEMVGDPSYPEHLAIWSIPTRIAVQMRIPLVVWGEQPQREYASPNGVEPATNLDASWVAQFGGMLGLRLDDLIGIECLSKHDLQVFRFPSNESLNEAGVKGIWLGDYMNWDGWKNSFIAQQCGFECLPFPVETSVANYENLDNYLTVLRDYLRYLKYGYTRGTDIICSHIRRGRLTREEGLIMEDGTKYFPTTSLGKPIEEVLAYFGLTLDEYMKACEKWTNKEIHAGT